MASRSSAYFSHKKIVTLGGGTGHFGLLRGLVEHNQPDLITAITGTWDSGGSSGRLRVEMGVLPSGDIRQCLLALMEDEKQRQVAQKLLNDRLADIEGPLKGHAIGNLIESQLQRIYQGQDRGINAARELFRVRAHIVPISKTSLELNAKTHSGIVIEGETNIDDRKDAENFAPDDRITGIYFDTIAEANPQAIEALLNADLIIFSAGDLYTSILPHLLVKGIPEAIKKSKAKVCFILNLMTKVGETDSFKASDFVEAFTYYLKDSNELDYIIANSNSLKNETLQKYVSVGQTPVEIDENRCQQLAPKAKIIKKNLAKQYIDEHLIRHDPEALAQTLLSIG